MRDMALGSWTYFFERLLTVHGRSDFPSHISTSGDAEVTGQTFLASGCGQPPFSPTGRAISIATRKTRDLQHARGVHVAQQLESSTEYQSDVRLRVLFRACPSDRELANVRTCKLAHLTVDVQDVTHPFLIALFAPRVNVVLCLGRKEGFRSVSTMCSSSCPSLLLWRTPSSAFMVASETPSIR